MHGVAQVEIAGAAQAHLVDLAGLVADGGGAGHALEAARILVQGAVAADLAQQPRPELGPGAWERAKEVVGVDFSRVAISEARKNLSNSGRKNLGFELINAESLHFPNEAFDLVTCRRGPVTDNKSSLQEAHRVLKRHGILMEITIGERDKENLIQIFARRQMQGSERVIDLKERILTEAGFENLQIKEYIATEIFPTIRDLIIRLKDSPIIPEFDAEKDKQYLEKIEKAYRSTRGIETPTHRVTIIANR